MTSRSSSFPLSMVFEARAVIDAFADLERSLAS
jgi:hypothetical protein